MLPDVSYCRAIFEVKDLSVVEHSVVGKSFCVKNSVTEEVIISGKIGAEKPVSDTKMTVGHFMDISRSNAEGVKKSLSTSRKRNLRQNI